MDFLPTSRDELIERGWYYYDFLLVTGDAYVDHPSFGTAIIGRMLESQGYRVAVLAQPNFRSTADFEDIGRPRYAVMISSGLFAAPSSNISSLTFSSSSTRRFALTAASLRISPFSSERKRL